MFIVFSCHIPLLLEVFKKGNRDSPVPITDLHQRLFLEEDLPPDLPEERLPEWPEPERPEEERPEDELRPDVFLLDEEELLPDLPLELILPEERPPDLPEPESPEERPLEFPERPEELRPDEELRPSVL